MEVIGLFVFGILWIAAWIVVMLTAFSLWHKLHKRLKHGSK